MHLAVLLYWDKGRGWEIKFEISEKDYKQFTESLSRLLPLYSLLLLVVLHFYPSEHQGMLLWMDYQKLLVTSSLLSKFALNKVTREVVKILTA